MYIISSVLNEISLKIVHLCNCMDYSESREDTTNQMPFWIHVNERQM